MDSNRKTRDYLQLLQDRNSKAKKLLDQKKDAMKDELERGFKTHLNGANADRDKGIGAYSRGKSNANAFSNISKHSASSSPHHMIGDDSDNTSVPAAATTSTTATKSGWLKPPKFILGVELFSNKHDKKSNSIVPTALMKEEDEKTSVYDDANYEDDAQMLTERINAVDREGDETTDLVSTYVDDFDDEEEEEDTNAVVPVDEVVHDTCSHSSTGSINKNASYAILADLAVADKPLLLRLRIYSTWSATKYGSLQAIRLRCSNSNEVKYLPISSCNSKLYIGLDQLPASSESVRCLKSLLGQAKVIPLASSTCDYWRGPVSNHAPLEMSIALEGLNEASMIDELELLVWNGTNDPVKLSSACKDVDIYLNDTCLYSSLLNNDVSQPLIVPFNHLIKRNSSAVSPLVVHLSVAENVDQQSSPIWLKGDGRGSYANVIRSSDTDAMASMIDSVLLYSSPSSKQKSSRLNSAGISSCSTERKSQSEIWPASTESLTERIGRDSSDRINTVVSPDSTRRRSSSRRSANSIISSSSSSNSSSNSSSSKDESTRKNRAERIEEIVSNVKHTISDLENVMGAIASNPNKLFNAIPTAVTVFESPPAVERPKSKRGVVEEVVDAAVLPVILEPADPEPVTELLFRSSTRRKEAMLDASIDSISNLLDDLQSNLDEAQYDDSVFQLAQKTRKRDVSGIDSDSKDYSLLRVADDDLFQCQYITIYLLDNYGDDNYIGLSGIEVCTDCSCTSAGVVDITCHKFDDSISDSYVNATKVNNLINRNGAYATCNEKRMFISPYVSGDVRYIRLNLGKKLSVSAIKIWNYNKPGYDINRGTKSIRVVLDDSATTASTHRTLGTYVLRLGPGCHGVDFEQMVLLRDIASPSTTHCPGLAKITNSSGNSSNNKQLKQDYEVSSKTSGLLWQFTLYDNWGDPYYIGLDEMLLYDENSKEIIIDSCNASVYAIPHSVQDLQQESLSTILDSRIPNNLFSTCNQCSSSKDGWLSPIATVMTEHERQSAASRIAALPHDESTVYPKYLYPSDNTIFILFNYPISIAYIKMRNYSARSDRGVRTFSIHVDNCLVFMGYLDKHVISTATGSNSTDYKTIYLNTKHFDHSSSTQYCGQIEQEVLHIDERKVMRRSDLMYQSNYNVDISKRPTTGVSAL